MDSKQTRTVLGAVAFVLCAWLISLFLFSTREPDRVPRVIPLSFNALRAQATAADFGAQFPRRMLGSLESRQSTGYLHDRLAQLGYAVSYSHFDARIARHLEVGRNVLAFKQGQSSEILAIIAHFDTVKTTNQGAMDNASGVGVLLELARVFSAAPARRSLLFILSDGGEWGSAGARDIAENYPQRNRIAAVLSLDHVSSGDLAAFCLEETGQMKGFTPAWLRELAKGAAETQGLPVAQVAGIREHFERAILISAADQGPFLRVGIPAVNLGSTSVDREKARTYLHSPQDTSGNLKTASFEKYGRAAEYIVRTLDAQSSFPAESSGFFRLWGGLYLRPVAVSALHIIMFLPFAVLFWLALVDCRKRLDSVRTGRELLVCLGTALPFLTVFFFVSLARAIRRIPLYSLYPPAAQDPVMANPPWGLLGAILGAGLFIAAAAYIVGKYSVRDLPKPDFYASKLVLLALMLVLVAITLLRNSYWATAFLLFPAWIWSWVGYGRTRPEQIRNGIWILAAGIPYYAALLIYAGRLGMGWNFVWYQILALSSGLFTLQSCLIGTITVIIGIRFLIIQFRPH